MTCFSLDVGAEGGGDALLSVFVLLLYYCFTTALLLWILVLKEEGMRYLVSDFCFSLTCFSLDMSLLSV
jgi:hypothetical protein